MKVRVTLDDHKLNHQITKALKAAPKEAAKAMTDCILDLAGESSRRAPIESGDLRSNCHGTIQDVTVFEGQKPVPAYAPPTSRLVGQVGYSLPYALRQHEDLTARHDRTDGYRVPSTNQRTGQPNKTAGQTVNMVAGGEAKFLEKPFEERKGRYVRRFEKVVEDSIK